jgi:hypothetical protein
MARDIKLDSLLLPEFLQRKVVTGASGKNLTSMAPGAIKRNGCAVP